jgi:hypothetical protein
MYHASENLPSFPQNCTPVVEIAEGVVLHVELHRVEAVIIDDVRVVLDDISTTGQLSRASQFGDDRFNSPFLDFDDFLCKCLDAVRLLHV